MLWMTVSDYGGKRGIETPTGERECERATYSTTMITNKQSWITFDSRKVFEMNERKARSSQWWQSVSIRVLSRRQAGIKWPKHANTWSIDRLFLSLFLNKEMKGIRERLYKIKQNIDLFRWNEMKSRSCCWNDWRRSTKSKLKESISLSRLVMF